MSKLLIDETPLQFLPSLAIALGGERPAIALQQLHYMLSTPRMSETHNSRRWVRASYSQWHDEFFPCWSEQIIRRVFTDLRNRGVVIYAQHEITSGDATGYVSIDYEALESLPHVALSATCFVSDHVLDSDTSHVSGFPVDHVLDSDTSTIRKKERGKRKQQKQLQPDSCNPRAAPNTPRARRRKSAPPSEPHPITDAMLNHFAVKAHREIMGVLLDAFCMEQIIAKATDETTWREFLTDWRLHPNWNRDNIAAQLDRYSRWSEIKTKTAPPSKSTPPAANNDAGGALSGAAKIAKETFDRQQSGYAQALEFLNRKNVQQEGAAYGVA